MRPSDDGWPAGIGLVGAGAMGRALAAGLTRGDRLAPGALAVADAVPAAVEAAVADCGGRPATLGEAASADLVCVAVKPKDAADALAAVGAALRPGAVVLSVVAGWDLDRLAAALPGVPLVRTMPNLAVRHGAGIVAVATRGLDGDREAALLALLRPLGAVVPLPEHLFAAATALAGSGPGLLALVAEGLEEGAVAAGLTRAQAREMVGAVVAGTAALLADGTDPALLRQRVSSPAGTTVAGLAVLERGAVRAHLADAVLAAARRASEL
ncbi:pyrroline-5-carboxylate reductase [Miltoncostaea marina]|uniref:pyrroline-5-carboxylate reductase n=1 Tax=Miltoncostaea marina TaxID=2843215 RepID=UPI001C3C200E|nr:pyrroline-5-carboxylate reductase [Miltoncostaea marina]